jgi:tripartite ATP-independent transporter DctM subunit
MTLTAVRTLPGRIEPMAAVLAIGAMAALPVTEMALRRVLGVGVPGSILIVQNLTLVVTFLGAALAARSDSLLALSTASLVPARWAGALRSTARVSGALVAATLAAASLAFVGAARGSGEVLVLGLPRWVVLAVMPAGYALVAGRLAASAATGRVARALAVLGVAAVAATTTSFDAATWARLSTPLILVVAGLTAIGLPLFAAIGAVGMLLFLGSGMPAATIPVNTCALTSFPALPAVPLFALAGGVLGAGRSSERIMRVLSAVAGWMPGGTAIATMLAFAFFTTLTGASGVTILSLGALMLPVLVRAGYPRSFAIGLVTVSGSIGLLLPPSLPIILYGVYAQQRVDAMLAGGLVPGLVLLALVGAWIAREGLRHGVPRTPFDPREARAAFAQARWELLLPAIVLVALFGGFATMTEAAALTACYALGIECVVFRELSVRHDVPRVLAEAVATTGAFLVILGVALGLTDYLMVEGWPARLLQLVQAHIHSRVAFLLALNAFLLVAGALMDIYSAIFVVVPLIAPMAAAYGVHPVHLGVIVLANLELGFLTPPMGENLFLSATRFGVPVLRVFRHAWPFYLVLVACVLLITYVPWLTLAPLRLFGF